MTKSLALLFALSLGLVLLSVPVRAEHPYDPSLPTFALSLTTPPAATTTGADQITATSARLLGSANPQGGATQGSFEWGTTLSYGNTTSPVSLGSGETSVPFTGTLSGLTPNTTYNYRAKATSTSGSDVGANNQFTTLPTSPSAYTLGFDDVTTSSATVHGLIESHEGTTTAWFEWGADTTLGNFTDSTTLGPEESAVIDGSLAELTPGTLYYYRAVSQNTGGTTYGNKLTFVANYSDKEYVEDTSTLALYHFNEPSGQLVQDYAKDYDGVSFGNELDGAPIEPGKYGFARSFNLDNDMVILDTDTTFDFATSSFTLECWALPVLVGAGQLTLIAKWDESNPDGQSYKLSAIYNGRIELALKGDTGPTFYVQTVDSVFSDNTWYHIAAVVDFSTQEVRLYLNGVLQPSYVIDNEPFPSSLHLSTTSLSVGSVQYGIKRKFSRSSTALFHCLIDEVRISNVARSEEEFIVSGSTVGGMKFNDLNRNGKLDEGEPGLEGWRVNLFLEKSGFVNYAITDANGKFSFSGLDPGTYILKEVDQVGWLPSYPKRPKLHVVVVDSGFDYDGYNFGNFEGCEYIGSVNGNWNNPNNWSCGRVPSFGDGVVITGSVIMDDPAEDSLFTLRVRTDGHLKINPNATHFKVFGGIEVDSAGQLEIDGATYFICYDDFFAEGDFNPGESTFEFAGDSASVISLSGSEDDDSTVSKRALDQTSNKFYNLVISGDSVSTEGNITVENQLTLNTALLTRDVDTVIIQNTSGEGIAGDAYVMGGSIRRRINTATTGEPYRFESSFSSLTFTSGSDLPDSVNIHTDTDPDDRTFELLWEEVPSTVDVVNNRITAAGIEEFSKWTMGRPGPGVSLLKTTAGDSLTQAGDVHRIYTIRPEAGTNFAADVSLRYDESELDPEVPEDSLILLRGPIVRDTVYQSWNLLSLPVTPEDASKTSLFPTAVSSAYAYTDAYVARTTLTPGEGFWVKFPATELASVIGDEIFSNTVAVTAGWNMIGGLSLPVTTSAITSEPPGIITGQYFAYANNGYRLTTTLQPLRGYWVKVSSDGELNLEVDSPEALKSGALTNPLADFNSLAIRDARGAGQELYFGKSASVDARRFELPPPAPDGAFDVRFASGRMLELTSEKESRLAPIHIATAAYPVRISWDVRKGKEYGVLLIDGKEMPLHGKGSAVVAAPPSLVQLRLSSSAVNALPAVFALHQNYPNPFNPTTTIHFDLPQDALVTLTVYNVLGQEVARLAHQTPYEAGTHAATFSAEKLPSGLYFYKIAAGEFNAVKKMMLVK